MQGAYRELSGLQNPYMHALTLLGVVGRLKPIYACFNTIGSCWAIKTHIYALYNKQRHVCISPFGRKSQLYVLIYISAYMDIGALLIEGSAITSDCDNMCGPESISQLGLLLYRICSDCDV